MKARPVKKLDPERPLGENAARIVKVRLDEMLDFAPRALDGKTKAQHDMRIAAKRLRYVLEVTGFCFGRPADTARRRARDLQDILGEIHDCDVMLPRVRGHLKELQRTDAAAVRERAGQAPDLDARIAAQAPHRTAYRGLDVLAVYLEARRELLTDRFIDFWRRQEETGTWKRLERSVDGYLRRAREARRTAKAAERARQQAEAAARAAAQAEAQAEQARLDRERATREAEEHAERHEQVQRRATPAPRRPS
jgi:CHAD domain